MSVRRLWRLRPFRTSSPPGVRASVVGHPAESAFNGLHPVRPTATAPSGTSVSPTGPRSSPNRSTAPRATWLAAIITAVLVLAACTSDGNEGSGQPPDATSIEATQLAGGAVFTTNADCSDNTIALFDDAADVNINGGPKLSAPQGLPDGEYYVQVTAPDGTILGSSGNTSPVTVTDGRFEQCLTLVDVVNGESTGSRGFDQTTDPNGRYQVSISLNQDFATTQIVSTVFSLRSSGAGDAMLNVVKFYDSNTNGIADSGEEFIDGWLVRITDDLAGYAAEAFTTWRSAVVPGSYSVRELVPDQPNWRTTTPAPIGVTLTDEQTATVPFGNVCLGSGGGQTTEFWTSRNGAALITPVQLRQLSERNLVDGGGRPFDPATYDELRNWMLETSSANMANALSVSLATMTLNVSTGKVDRNARIHAPTALTSTPTGFITVTDLMQEADTALATSGSTPAGSSQRSYQEALHNPLERANSDLDFVQPAPCPLTFGQLPGVNQ
jgi:hypothetical protein